MVEPAGAFGVVSEFEESNSYIALALSSLHDRDAIQDRTHGTIDSSSEAARKHSSNVRDGIKEPDSPIPQNFMEKFRPSEHIAVANAIRSSKHSGRDIRSTLGGIFSSGDL